MKKQKYPLPNLFDCESLADAYALYATAIPRLLWRGEAVETVRQLRLVRTFGRRRNVAPRHTEWTRGFELEALIAIGDGQGAWRVARAHLREHYPRLANQPLAKRLGRMVHFVRYWEMPAAYFSGRIRHATEAMELFLDWQMKRADAYEIRNDLFNGDERPNPSQHVRVTLFHLYRELDRTLGDWPRWPEWVAGLHPGLLELCELKAADLAARPGLMSVLHERLRAAEVERRPAFFTFGQKDLLEAKGTVLARQANAQARRDRAPSSHAVMLAEKRALYFPWVTPYEL